MLITGSTDNSRLVELKKYAVGVSFVQQYISGGTWTTDGVDYGSSPSIDYVVYYLGGIRFVDETGESTTFSYTANNTYSFVDEQYVKNPNESKIISNPKIIDDVFIVRDSLTAFDKNFRLEYIKNIIDLTTYAGGRYFNIINNT